MKHLEQTEKDSVFKPLYLQYYPELEKYCRAICNDEESAKDLLSETVARTYENFGKIRDLSKFKPYLFGICRNLFLRQLRDSKTFESIEKAEYMAAATESDRSEIDRLYKALAMLSMPQREAITMFELSGFKLNEIAEILGMPVNTVKTHLSRGREALRQILMKDEIKTI